MSNTKKCPGKESFQRINYLFQLASELATETPATHSASLNYTNLAINISKKAVQRVDTDIKQKVCKRCRAILLPGLTCKVRIKKKQLIQHCLKCKASKIFNISDEDYLTWCQRPESLVEVLDYTPKEPANSKKTTN